MNTGQALELLHRNDNLFQAAYDFAGGALVLFSDHSHLKCVVFGHRTKLLQVLQKYAGSMQVPPLEKALAFFDAYFKRKEAVLPPIDHGSYTDAEKIVYSTLMSIPAGRTVSYGELARLSGFPGGARFVGNTMAKNMFPIIIPCHRVIRSDGSTGNYSSGTPLKEFLLNHENSMRS